MSIKVGDIITPEEQERIRKFEEEINALRDEYYDRERSKKNQGYLDDVAAKIAQHEVELNGLASSLNARKDRNYIFFEADSEKNRIINVELNKIKALQYIIKGVKSNVSEVLEQDIGKPKRMEEARGEILGRERARNAILASMEPAAQTLRRQAQDNFTRAYKSEPLDREEALRLVRLEEGLDKLRMAGVDANIFKRGAQEVQNVVKDAVAASEIIGAETFYTAGNTVALLLGWWIILPMKAVSFATDIVSRGFRATEAFFQTLNEYVHKQADQSGIPGKVGWGTLRLLTGAITLAAAAVKGVTRLVSDLFDVDKMIRKGNMGAAFAMGFVGAAVLISFAIASVFTFGIPIAMIAVGAGLAAAIGLAKVGIEYNKFKETRAARRNFQLTAGEETRLLEFEQRNPKFREEMSREREAKLQSEGQAQIVRAAGRERQLLQDNVLGGEMQAAMNPEPKKLSRREQREQRYEERARVHAERLRNVAQPRASGEPWSSRVEEEPKKHFFPGGSPKVEVQRQEERAVQQSAQQKERDKSVSPLLHQRKEQARKARKQKDLSKRRPTQKPGTDQDSSVD